MELVPSSSAQYASDAEEKQISQVASFYRGKSVFITGAAGFLGAVLLETLLRCCPDIRTIYILLREKKGVPPEARKEQIFKKKIFQPLKKENAWVFEKVKVVAGDITLPDLGMSSKAIEEMKTEVSVVFHCAAVISFMKPLRFMLIQNVQGAKNVLDFCKSLPNLTAVVHTSTAYSNCNKKDEVIKEEIYRTAVPAKKFLEAIRSNAGDEELATMEKRCSPAWPNTYTFSKALAEDLIADYASDLPVAVVRPSIIISCWKGIVPGYTEEGAGLIDVSVGIGKGFIRVLYCDEKKIVDIVPVDCVSNTLISAAWGVGTGLFSSPLVANYTTGRISPCTWGHLINTLYHMQELHPLPKMYQLPSLVMRGHKTTYWASALVNHYAPAICIDLFLMAMRKKPRLTKLYKFYDVALKYLGFFLTNEWRFQCETAQQIDAKRNSKDNELFPIDLTDFTIESMAPCIRNGAPFYEWSNDKRNLKDRIPIAYKRSLLTNFIKWTVIVWFGLFIIFVITKSVFRTSMF